MTNTIFSNEIEGERRILHALYEEYQMILKDHRIHMRPVLIQLFHSTELWGKWDPLTRTIFIAKNLVHDHSWFSVRGILAHEMAHQFVDEECFNPSTFLAKPHGEAFLFACEKLGIPHEFRKSRILFQETPLDWRLTQTHSVKLLDKVKKLLALATSTHENEALAAMNKVRELYAKYNLNQLKDDQHLEFMHLIITHQKKRIEAYQNQIISILVEHFYVRVLMSSLFHPPTGESHRVIEMIGTRENVLMAEYVYYFLIQQSQFWVEEKQKETQKKLSAFEKKSFRFGILTGFSEKLNQMARQKTTSAWCSANSPSSKSFYSNSLSVVAQALQPFQKKNPLDRYLAKVYPRISHRTLSRSRVDPCIFAAGKKLGRKLSLKKAVTTTATPLKVLQIKFQGKEQQ